MMRLTLLPSIERLNTIGEIGHKAFSSRWLPPTSDIVKNRQSSNNNIKSEPIRPCDINRISRSRIKSLIARWFSVNAKYDKQAGANNKTKTNHINDKTHDKLDKRRKLRRKTLLITGPVVGCTVAIGVCPFVLYMVGFTKAGVAAGSLAAFFQTPTTVAGSWFAACQSAGVLGLAFKTTAGIGALTCGAVWTAGFKRI